MRNEQHTPVAVFPESTSKPSLIVTWLFALQFALLTVVSISFHSVIDTSQAHAPYFTENFNLAAFIFGTYTLSMTAIYYFTRRQRYSWPGILHFLAGLPLFLLTVLDRIGLIDHGPPRRYYTNYDSKLLDIFPVYEMSLYFLFVILFLVGLVILLLNQVRSRLGANKNQ